MDFKFLVLLRWEKMLSPGLLSAAGRVFPPGSAQTRVERASKGEATPRLPCRCHCLPLPSPVALSCRALAATSAEAPAFSGDGHFARPRSRNAICFSFSSLILSFAGRLRYRLNIFQRHSNCRRFLRFIGKVEKS